MLRLNFDAKQKAELQNFVLEGHPNLPTYPVTADFLLKKQCRKQTESVDNIS